AAVALVEAQEQIEDGGLARAGRSNQGYLAAGGYIERHAVQNGGIAVIAETDIVKENGAAVARHGKGRSAWCIHDPRASIDGGEHAVGGRYAGRSGGPELA